MHTVSMICHQEIHCPNCGSNKIMKAGWNARGTQRYRCKNSGCKTKTFMLKYRYRAYAGVKEQAVEMTINVRGIRDTARVLKINKNTVISTLKKSGQTCPGKPQFSYPKPSK